MRCLPVLLFVILFTSTLFAQDENRQADFLIRMSGSRLEVQPQLPPLQQIAGAPPAFYDYYWEFGDGHFSFQEAPVHFYEDTTEKEVLLLATGKYDNGKAPRSRKRRTKPDPKNKQERMASTQTLPNALEQPSDWLGMKAVRNPSPGEELILVVSYANQSPVVQSGRLQLAFNQKIYPKTHFEWLEARTHNGEQSVEPLLSQNEPHVPAEAWAGEVPPSDWYSLLLPARNANSTGATELFREEHNWTFDGLQPGEARNFFVSLQATEAMLADTNAIITLQARLTTDDGRVDEVYPLELEIVASHDPNYIAVSRNRMGYRRMRQNDLTYKVHFQNTGEGPASRVEIKTDLPSGYDPESLRVIETQPAVPNCPESMASWSCLDTAFQDGQLVFTFRDIYLPGTRQEGVGERDSTKGYVKYRLSPGRRVEKRPFSARAAIVFDENPPIRTGRAATRFRPGWSPGVMAGRVLGLGTGNTWSVGLSVAPFSPYRLFWQGEVWAGLPTESQTTESSRDTIRTESDLLGLPFVATVDTITSRTLDRTEREQRFGVVPLQLRYNFSDWLAGGTGLLLEITYREQITNRQEQQTVQVYDPDGQFIHDFSQTFDPVMQSFDLSSFNYSGSWFAELQIGQVRKGPALGLRGVLPFDGRPAYGLAFLQWRF
jgi:hypothetical protein